MYSNNQVLFATQCVKSFQNHVCVLQTNCIWTISQDYDKSWINHSDINHSWLFMSYGGLIKCQLEDYPEVHVWQP